MKDYGLISEPGNESHRVRVIGYARLASEVDVRSFSIGLLLIFAGTQETPNKHL